MSVQHDPRVRTPYVLIVIQTPIQTYTGTNAGRSEFDVIVNVIFRHTRPSGNVPPNCAG